MGYGDEGTPQLVLQILLKDFAYFFLNEFPEFLLPLAIHIRIEFNLAYALKAHACWL
jgi:hypothetical protein